MRLGHIAIAALLVAACAPKPSADLEHEASTDATVSTVATTGFEVVPGTRARGSTIDGELTTDDGRTRSYHLYVPSELPTGSVPLLIALHGGIGWGEQYRRQSRFDELAEANGLLVVFPDGVGIGNKNANLLRTWNGGYCCGTAVRQGVDDVAFIDALIDEISAEYDVDPRRVFAAGHSNGGIMAYRLACELSNRIVAIGLQAGSLGVDSCAPARPVSVLHLHGTADENHPIDGGVGDRSLSAVEFRSAAYSVETVAAAMGCAPSTTIWADCDEGVEVQLIAVAGAPHSWMPDASEVILGFLLNHPRGA